MDIQKIITDIVDKLKNDSSLKDKFVKDPVKTVEELTGIDLPDDQINAVIDGIKAKVNVEEVAGEAKGFLAKLKALFGKK